MKKLFLSSSFAQVEDAFAGFVGDDGAGKHVTFIATASVVENVNFYVEQGRQALQRQGLEVDMLDISTAKPENRRRMLQDNDYIYVSGGNTFYLRQELRRTGADQDLVQEVESGTPYLGESAGAMVVAPHIEYAQAMDDLSAAADLEDFSGLGLIDFFPVPHYGNAPFAEAAEQIMATYGTKLALRPLSNTQAMIVDAERVLVVGT
ncbi:S51 family peptidase [Salinisphaera sp. C84B14]|uniref:Type 1 glutamine amidotransferase-like domain-containing protein n=1 Tax=Salinisphaera sp. C84B14 TaxID=1304155 RepID=UPI00333FBFC6